MTCAIEFLTIIQGEDRSLPLRVANSDQSPYDLTGATEIRARFKKADGTVLEKRLSRSEITVTDAHAGRLNVLLSTLDTPQLIVGQRQDFTLVVDRGARASAQRAAVTITADIPGLEGNVALTFDGVKTVAQVLAVWNIANPTRSLSVTAGSDSTVFAAVVLSLSGGTSNRRKVNFKRAVSVEKESV